MASQSPSPAFTDLPKHPSHPSPSHLSKIGKTILLRPPPAPSRRSPSPRAAAPAVQHSRSPAARAAYSRLLLPAPKSISPSPRPPHEFALRRLRRRSPSREQPQRCVVLLLPPQILKAELLVQFSIIYRGTHLINHFFLELDGFDRKCLYLVP
uniref:Uncharacterized protein n=1 Tax=Oryza punctata TaxID=4537 RepID=A0A0E0MF08_ORYPU